MFPSSFSRIGHFPHVDPCQQHGEPLLCPVASHRLRHRQLWRVHLRRHVQPLLPVVDWDVQLAGCLAHHRRPPAQPVCLRRSHETSGDGPEPATGNQRCSRRRCHCAPTKEESYLPVLPDEKAWTCPLHLVRHLFGARVFHPTSLSRALRHQPGDG